MSKVKAPLETLAAREGYRSVSHMIAASCRKGATHQPAICMSDECDHVANVPVEMKVCECPQCRQPKMTPLLMLLI